MEEGLERAMEKQVHAAEASQIKLPCRRASFLQEKLRPPVIVWGLGLWV